MNLSPSPSPFGQPPAPGAAARPRPIGPASSKGSSALVSVVGVRPSGGRAGVPVSAWRVDFRPVPPSQGTRSPQGRRPAGALELLDHGLLLLVGRAADRRD